MREAAERDDKNLTAAPPGPLSALDSTLNLNSQ
jgi:hypothetical protein